MAGVSSTMLQKLKGFLVGRKSGEISATEAEKIQKASYALMHAEVKKQFSPAYLSILPELDNPEKQVFEAAVYYLTKIASQKTKYQQDILEIMAKKASDHKLNPEFREHLKTQMQNILQKNNR
ncbi:MAG: hypothetical protein J6J35_05650 [Alphaproteobacteria bacterium]|nr:hypothetical protein [Alphaproteobacteria bacterium]MBP3687829.1 hypothetical protein [Alphaproteobacteria bacterium]